MFYSLTLLSKILSLFSCFALAILIIAKIPLLEDAVIYWVITLITIRLLWLGFQFFSFPDLSRISLTPENKSKLRQKIEKHLTFTGGMNVMLRLIVAVVLFILLCVHHEYLLGILSIASFFVRMFFEIEAIIEIESLKHV